MIILDIDKPKRCGECPMHNDGNDYCKLAHDHASFVRAKGCPIQEPKTGHWIYWHTNGFGRKIYKCSKCNWNGDTLGYNFCPDCGANMRGAE